MSSKIILGETMTLTTTTHRTAVLPTLWIGLATSGLVTAATVLDQLVFGTLETHLQHVYEPYNVAWQSARTMLIVTLLAIGVAGMAGWILTARAANPIRAAILGTTLFLLGVTAALTLLTASEYGQTLVPTWLGLVNLLPTAIGLLATVQLWRTTRTHDT
jgi:hypothetical protein